MTDSQSWLWAPKVQISGTVVHGLAILVTTFRLVYRRCMARFWWEDIWAALALICDIGCFVSIWTQRAPADHLLPPINIISTWLLSVTITCVLWFARMSILSSVVRIANPSPTLRRIAYCIGALFLAMGGGILVQRLVICAQNLCQFTNSITLSNAVAIAQLVTDVISDTILVVAPVGFLRDVKLSRDRRILILSAFSASILITGVTIFHSVLLLEQSATVTLIIVHVKTALALLLCNALVFVTLVYRLIHKSANDLEHSILEGASLSTSVVQLTSVIGLPSQVSSHARTTTSPGKSVGIQPHEDSGNKNKSVGLSANQLHATSGDGAA